MHRSGRTGSSPLLVALLAVVALVAAGCDELVTLQADAQAPPPQGPAGHGEGPQPSPTAVVAVPTGTPAPASEQQAPSASPGPSPSAEQSDPAAPSPRDSVEPPAPAAGDVLYANDFDDGLSDIYVHDSGCSGTRLVSPTSSPTRAGGGALELRISDCDERAEVGTKILEAGRDYVVSWSMFVPTDSGRENGYTIVQQTGMQGGHREKDRFDISECGNPLGSRMTLGDDGLGYRVSIPRLGGNGTIVMDCEHYDVPLRENEWMDFRMEIRYSTGQDGYMRLRQDSGLVFDYRGNLLHPEFPQVGLWTMGAYVGNPGHGERHLYLDEFRIQEGKG